MSTLIRFFIGACIAGLLSVTGCTKGKPSAAGKPRIAFVTNGVVPFWVIASVGAHAAGEKFNAEVSVHMPAEGITDQKRILEDLLTRGVDGIAVSPIDPENQRELLDQAAARTKLITHDSDAPGTKRLVYVGMDNYAAGRLCGKLVKEALPEGGKIMIFLGRMEQDNARRRRQGAIDEILDRPADPKRHDPPGAALANAKYTLVGTLTDQFDRVKAKANAEDALSRYPDLDAMLGLFVYSAPVCLDVLKQAGKLGKIKVIGFDEADETLQAIKDGTCVGTVVQNPYSYGYESVRVLAGLIHGDGAPLPESGFIDIPARQIVRGNVEAFWSDLKKQSGAK
jgi:ribose transport system substrate-binding protein